MPNGTTPDIQEGRLPTGPAVGGEGGQVGGVGQGEQQEPTSPYTFQRTEFVVRESTGRKVGKRGEKGAVTEAREVIFSQDLAEQYENFLYDHLQNLVTITNPQILDNDAHRNELQLREALTTDNKPDKEKIKEYLESPEGWMITTLLFEDLTAKKLFSMGLLAATRPRGERVDQIDENTIRLHLDQGILNRVVMDHIWPYLNERVNVTAGRPEERGLAGRFSDLRRWQSIVGQMGGSLGMGGSAFMGTLLRTGDIPTSLAAGVAAGAVVPGLMALRNTLNQGVTIDLRQYSAALELIQHDPNELAYLNSVLGIDANNFVVTGPNQIELRPGHGLAANTIRETQAEIFQGLYAREQFYTSLGIPHELLDALPEQHLYFYFEGRVERAEQTGVRWQKRHGEIFQAQTRGILDTAGRPPSDPNFLTGGATLDFEGNLRRYMQARRQVITEIMNDHAIKVRDGEESENARTRINEKIKARKEGGDELERRKKATSQRKEALEKEKDKLSPDKTVLDEYTTARTSLDTEQRKFETEFEDAFIAGRDVVGELARVNDLLTDQANVVSIPFRRNTLRVNLNAVLIVAFAQADADLLAEYGANPIPADVRTTIHHAVAQQTRELFQAQLDALTQEESDLKSQRTRLIEIRNSISVANRTLTEKADRIVTSAKENLTTMHADYMALGGWGIGDVMLRTMTVDELMVQINAANAVDAANGWPAGPQNENPANRTRVINAIAEAKAVYEESFDQARNDPDPAVGRLINYTAVTGWDLNGVGLRITEDQLRSMPRSQLMILINQANALNNVNGWPAGPENANPDNIRTLNLAVEEARNRMVLRHNAALTARLADLDTQIQTEQTKIDAINFESEIDVLTTIDDLMDRQGKIFEMAYEVAANRERYTNITPVDPNDPTFSAAEKAVFDGAIPPVGYWRMMNALFDYETRTDRNVYVGKIIKTLPPRALARRINLALGMGAGHADIEDITTALNQLDILIGNESFTGIDVRSMFRDIINGLRLQANAL